MDLINDLETELALAILVEKRYRQKIDSTEAKALITRVTDLLKQSRTSDAPDTPTEAGKIAAAEGGH